MSTSDRELLELAARAACFPIHDWNGDWPVEYVERWNGNPNEPPEQDVVYWNPLSDDGDALRLAVKLRLEIYFFDGFSEVVAEHNAASFEAGREQYAEDMNAATRRAIVRAAAEIGRSMS